LIIGNYFLIIYYNIEVFKYFLNIVSIYINYYKSYISCRIYINK